MVSRKVKLKPTECELVYKNGVLIETKAMLVPWQVFCLNTTWNVINEKPICRLKIDNSSSQSLAETQYNSLIHKAMEATE